jgi:sugar/nucleoside kinase (ribokinase family)
VGSIAFDDIKTHKKSVKTVVGGSASYAAVAASYFARPKLVGVVGTDFTKKHLAPFKNRKVNLDSLQIKKGKTFAWAASYDADFKNATTLSTKLNVFENFTPKLSPQAAKCPAAFLANIEPKLQLAVLEQMQNPRLVVCDTMNFWITHAKKDLLKLLKRVNILLVNEEEARQLTSIHNLIKAGKAILKLGPQMVVVKLGPNGALLINKDTMRQIPPYLIEEPVDTTGAGDSFGGGFTGFLASTKNWADIKNIKKALAVGTVMASFAIENFSITKLAQLDKKTIDSRLKTYKKMTSF